MPLNKNIHGAGGDGIQKRSSFLEWKCFFENYGHTTKKFRYVAYHARDQNQTNARGILPF